MSMEINSSYDTYRTKDTELLKAKQDKTKEAEHAQGTESESSKLPVLKDEYISSEKLPAAHSGLYRLGQDEDGKHSVLFDAPKPDDDTDGAESPEMKSDTSEDDSKQCTINTDRVDREIEKLKEREKELEQQIKVASGDERKEKELQRQLTQVKNELSQKDNDTYRRQHSSVTNSFS